MMAPDWYPEPQQAANSLADQLVSRIKAAIHKADTEAIAADEDVRNLRATRAAQVSQWRATLSTSFVGRPSYVHCIDQPTTDDILATARLVAAIERRNMLAAILEGLV